MVLRLKTWESKSLPDLIRNIRIFSQHDDIQNAAPRKGGGVFVCAVRQLRLGPAAVSAEFTINKRIQTVLTSSKLDSLLRRRKVKTADDT